MLYNFYFNDFESFTNLFQTTECVRADGTTFSTRKNNIALQCYKYALANKKLDAFCNLFEDAGALCNFKDIVLNKLFYPNGSAMSDIYEIHELNTAENPKLITVRRKATGRVETLKCGKFIRALLQEKRLDSLIGEVGVNYICEVYSARYSATKTYRDAELVVDYDFEAIYSSGNISSCMAGTEYYSFYEDSVNARAAALYDGQHTLLARCVIFDDVEDEDACHYRLAERQYGVDQFAKIILINRLIAGGYIDGYKSPHAGCGDSRAFILNDGTSLYEKSLRIPCSLSSDDYVAYQDSFKWLDDFDGGYAYNRLTFRGESLYGEISLEVTNGYADDGNYVYDDITEERVHMDDIREIGLHNGETLYTTLNDIDLSSYGYKYSNYHASYSNDEFRYSEIMEDYISIDEYFEIEQEYMEECGDYNYDDIQEVWTDEDVEPVWFYNEQEKKFYSLNTENYYEYDEYLGYYFNDLDSQDIGIIEKQFCLKTDTVEATN